MKRSSPLSKSPWKDSGQANQPATISNLGYPVLLHWWVAGVFLVLAIVGAVWHIVPLLAVSVFMLVLFGLSRFSSGHSLQDLSYELRLDRDRAFPDETVELDIGINNRKWQPLPWLEFEIDMPFRLANGVLKQATPFSRERLRWASSVSGGQKIAWRERFTCRARGDYVLGPVRMRSGDIFGLFPKEAVFPCSARLMVYPRIVALAGLPLPLKELIEDQDVRKTIYDDSSRTVGARDYRPGDPFRRIHWKASSRRGELHVRVYESTSSLNLVLVLDAGSFVGQIPETFELAVSVAASLAFQTIQGGSPAGLITNSIPEVRRPPSSSRAHLRLLLEDLARVETKSRRPINEQIEHDLLDISSSGTMVIITSVVSPPLAALARRLQGEGFSLLVLAAETAHQGEIPGVPVISLSSVVAPSRDGAKP